MSTTTPRPRRARRRFWLILAAVALVLFAGWHWLHTPAMRLQAVTPLDGVIDDGYEPFFFNTHDVLLHKEPVPHNRTMMRLTLIGWDGKPRWRVTVPWPSLLPDKIDRDDFMPWRDLALSPDGHLLAMALPDKKHEVRVLSWRDGRLLGDVHLPWSPGGFYNLQATESGRVWLMQFVGSLRLWAIDGTQIADGAYPAKILGRLSPYGRRYLYSLSPDGTILLGGNPRQRLYDYATVQVIGKRVVVTSRSTGTISGLTPNWYPNGWVVGDNGEILGPNGMIHGPDGWQNYALQYNARPVLQMRSHQTNCVRLFLPPPDHPWEIQLRTAPQISAMCSTDGHIMMTTAMEQPSNLMAML